MFSIICKSHIKVNKRKKLSISAFDNGHAYRFVRERPTAGVPPIPPPGGCARGKYPWVDP